MGLWVAHDTQTALLDQLPWGSCKRRHWLRPSGGASAQSRSFALLESKVDSKRNQLVRMLEIHTYPISSHFLFHYPYTAPSVYLI